MKHIILSLLSFPQYKSATKRQIKVQHPKMVVTSFLAGADAPATVVLVPGF